MDRLTRKGEEYCNTCNENPDDGGTCVFRGLVIEGPCWRKAVHDRLAAYENTGLTPDEVNRLTAEIERYRKDVADGMIVRLPETLTAPYELNERYWVCGWDSDDCTLTIQDRKLREAAEAALKAQEVPHAGH